MAAVSWSELFPVSGVEATASHHQHEEEGPSSSGKEGMPSDAIFAATTRSSVKRRTITQPRTGTVVADSPRKRDDKKTSSSCCRGDMVEPRWQRFSDTGETTPDNQVVFFHGGQWGRPACLASDTPVSRGREGKTETPSDLLCPHSRCERGGR